MRFDGGVWDTSLQAVFIATDRVVRGSDPLQTAMAIDAIDSATGKLLWRTECPGQPVNVLDRSVVATRWRPGESVLTLWLLDSGDGRITAEHTLPLPSWTAAPGVTLTVDSTAKGGQEAGDSLLVLWHGISVYAGGAPPPKEVLDAYTKDERGGLRLDLGKGTAQVISSASLAQRSPETLPILKVTGAEGEQSVAAAGDIVLTLDLEPAEGASPADSTLILTARSPADSTVRWRHPMRDLISQQPPPLPE